MAACVPPVKKPWPLAPLAPLAAESQHPPCAMKTMVPWISWHFTNHNLPPTGPTGPNSSDRSNRAPRAPRAPPVGLNDGLDSWVLLGDKCHDLDEAMTIPQAGVQQLRSCPTWWLTLRHGIDGPNRNRWFTLCLPYVYLLKMGGSFHGKLLNNQRVPIWGLRGSQAAQWFGASTAEW